MYEIYLNYDFKSLICLPKFSIWNLVTFINVRQSNQIYWNKRHTEILKERAIKLLESDKLKRWIAKTETYSTLDSRIKISLAQVTPTHFWPRKNKEQRTFTANRVKLLLYNETYTFFFRLWNGKVQGLKRLRKMYRDQVITQEQNRNCPCFLIN